MPDLIVVGGGVAGLSAAIAARGEGADVTLITKVHPTRSYSVTVQDGFNAALAGTDSPERHSQDTIVAGDFLADQNVVQDVCREAPRLVETLDRMGVSFNRTAEGRIAQVQLPASSEGRACFVDDMTGHVLTQVLYEQSLKAAVTIHEEWIVTSLAMEEGVCRGVLALDIRSGQIHLLPAKAVVLATGGARRIYEGSTASVHCTADGFALALRAGASLVDMEMVQYYPAVAGQSTLALSPLLFADGAILVNQREGRFLETTARGMKEMVFADVAARAVAQEIEAARDGTTHVWLRAKVSPEDLKGRYFHTNHILSRLLGLDLSRDPIPIRPAMHHSLGGVQIDTEGATGVPGLFAAGECAGPSVHGAAGLDGNYLLTSFFFGQRAGATAARYAQAGATPSPSATLLQEEEKRLAGLLHREGGPAAQTAIRQELGHLVATKVGLFRNADGLKEAASTIAQLKERYQRVGVQNTEKRFNFELMNYLELGFMLDTAEVIVAAALAREESRGSHYRTDFPTRNDGQWLKHIVATQTKDGLKLDFRPVTITQWPVATRSF